MGVALFSLLFSTMWLWYVLSAYSLNIKEYEILCKESEIWDIVQNMLYATVKCVQSVVYYSHPGRVI